MSSCGRVTSVCAEPSQCVHRSEPPGSAGDSPVGTAPGQGLRSHPAGGAGELDLDPAKPLETQGLDSWPLESPPCVPPLCQFWCEQGADKVPQDGQGWPSRCGTPGTGHCEPLPASAAVLVWDTTG